MMQNLRTVLPSAYSRPVAMGLEWGWHGVGMGWHGMETATYGLQGVSFLSPLGNFLHFLLLLYICR